MNKIRIIIEDIYLDDISKINIDKIIDEFSKRLNGYIFVDDENMYIEILDKI